MTLNVDVDMDVDVDVNVALNVVLDQSISVEGSRRSFQSLPVSVVRPEDQAEQGCSEEIAEQEGNGDHCTSSEHGDFQG